MFSHHPHLLQVAILAVVVEAVADDEFVGDFEAGPVGLHGDFVASSLFEQDADFHVGRAEFLQARGEGGKGAAGVENVIDDEDVPTRDRLADDAEAADFTGARAARIAGEPDAGNFRFEIDGAEQVGEEKKRAVHDAEKEGTLALVVAGDAPAELANARADLRLGKENAAGFHGIKERAERIFRQGEPSACL